MAYGFFRGLFRLILSIFFSDIDVFGLDNVPDDMGVILAGNHANQFIDGLVMLTSSPRDVRFLVAKKSMDRPAVGFFAKQLKSIAVLRPQDIAKFGPGKVAVTAGEDKLVGVGTKFTEQQPGIPVIVTGGGTVKVKEVVSDTEIILAAPAEKTVADAPYKFLPKVDQGDLFVDVWTALAEGSTIGIFPEGGSHDRTELLPLKAGIAMFALGAVAKHGKPVAIVPTGLNYFRRERFRSRVIVEFGPAIVIQPDDPLVKLYGEKKRDATAQLLDTVTAGLNRVVHTAPSFEQLSLIYLARNLYAMQTNKKKKLSREQRHNLQRRFIDAYSQFSDEPQVQELGKELAEYHETLRSYGISPRKLRFVDLGFFRALFYLFYRPLESFVLAILALPGLILNLPIRYACTTLSKKEQKKALAASTVKVEARDVVASYKLLVASAVIPALYLFYVLAALGVGIYLGSMWIWILPVGTFVAYPLISYATAIVTERGMRLFSTLPALLFRVFFCCGRMKELRSWTEELQQKVVDVVEALGPEMGESVWGNRIVKPKARKGSSTSTNSGGGAVITDKPSGNNSDSASDHGNDIPEEKDDVPLTQAAASKDSSGNDDTDDEVVVVEKEQRSKSSSDDLVVVKKEDIDVEIEEKE